MPTLDQHSSGKFVKLIYIGHSGSGKTGSLTSLAAAGYHLRIIDFDNGLDSLVHHVRAECPEVLTHIDYETIRDKYKSGPSGIGTSAPKSIVKLSKLLDKWSDDSVPAEWGEDTILVLDSLTSIGKAAYEWARAQNPYVKEKRQFYQGAQELIENIIAAVTSEDFQTNVLILSHIDVRDEDGINRGFVSSIGRALGDKLPRYVNTMILAESSGTGAKVRRRIKTFPTSMLDLKNPAPMKIESEYPLETGLATLFSQLKAKEA